METFFSSLPMYHSKLEEFLIEGEENEDLKVKKKMVVYHILVLLACYLFLPLINPSFSIVEAILGLIMTVIECIIIKTRSYSFTVGFYLVTNILTLYSRSMAPVEALRVIGILLVQHNMLFLVMHNKVMCLLHVSCSLILVNNCSRLLQDMVEEGDFSVVKDAITQHLCEWPLLYILNILSTLHLTNKYSKALQEKKEAQTKLNTQNQELSSLNLRLKDTLKLLEQTNKELKEAVNARELFIASVSHELRNPLNSMLGNIELMGLEVKDPKLISMLDTCKVCGEVLLGLINNILDAAKISAEKLEVNYHPGNLYNLIAKVWIVSTIKMKQKEIKGYLEIGNNLPKHVLMDSDRINQILLNLIGNATKFTEKGFVRVRVSWIENNNIHQLQDSLHEDFYEVLDNKSNQSLLTEPGDISFRSNPQSKAKRITSSSFAETEVAERNLEGTDVDIHQNQLQRSLRKKLISHLKLKNNYSYFEDKDVGIEEALRKRSNFRTNLNGILKIDIIDSGCGIADKAKQLLFQPFAQADSSITRRFGGTGLGLYIVKQLIQKMGGQIYVKSKENIGTYFTLGIPIQSVPNVNTKGLISAKSLMNRYEHKRALVVDDDPLNQMIMSDYLKKLSIISEYANDGQEALEKFKAKNPNYYSFITMDVQMPNMDGFSAAKAIRKYESQTKRLNTPIIVVTANCTDDEKRRCLDPRGDIRASYFFRKPFKFEECQSAVITLIHKIEY